MSAKCKYGDVESVELVDCKYNQQTGSISCPQPKKRVTRAAVSDQKSNRFEMDVEFVGGDGQSKKKTFVAEYDESEDSDEPLMGRLEQPRIPISNGIRPQPNGRRSKGAFVRKLFALLLADLTGELLGTFFMTLIICSIVTSAVVTGAQSGLWQVAIVCGVGVSLSIYCTSHFSDAHLNPAITVAFAIVRWKTFSMEENHTIYCSTVARRLLCWWSSLCLVSTCH